MKILVIDDNAAVLESVSMLIKDMGHEVLEANNGYEAIRNLEENLVDILLTDMNMPGMNGDEVIKWVIVNRPSIKTILMSGHPLVKKFAKKCGANS